MSDHFLRSRFHHLPFPFLLIFLFSFCSLFAQKQANIWYFGRDGVGLDFNCIPPSVVTGHSMTGWEGVCTVSDPNTGKVLFYTNGDKIYNRGNVQMQGGSHISPTGEFFEPLNTVTQVLAIPRPGNPEQYYLLATDIQGGKIQSADQSLNGVWAVLIDMAAGNSLGVVIDRFSVYNPLFATEKLMAVPQANGNDFWVIGHEFDNDRFFVFALTAAGFSSSPDLYALGQSHAISAADTDNLNAIGELKASPDGTMLAGAVSGAGYIELFDFDNTTGQIANAQLLATEEGVFGLSFSPDNSKLYAGTWTGELFQFDLAAADIPASKTLLYDYAGGCFGSLKIGPDLKIYVSRYQGGPFAQDGGDGFLGVINDPNAAGIAADYVHDGIFLEGRKCNWGLNNVMEQNYYEQIELSLDLGPDMLVPCDDFEVPLNAFNDCAEYLWQDGSTEADFTADSPGTYFVEVIYGNCVVSDTLDITVEDIDVEVNLGNDTTICPGENILLDATIPQALSYHWQDGSELPTFNVTEEGVYSVSVVTACGAVNDAIIIEAGTAANLEEAIQVPNTFTPNNDDLNDFFQAEIDEEITGDIENFRLIVYNRWGQRVFSTTDVSEGWDGRFENENAAADVYFWVLNIEVRLCGGTLEIYKKQGDLSLIR